LGPGDPRLISRAAWQVIEGCERLYLRTSAHPAVDGLPAGPELISFDSLYEEHSELPDVYRAIVDELALVPPGSVYAVPGDPSVGEATVQGLRQAGIRMVLVPGVSFIEPCLAAVGYDALDGLVVTDAFELAVRHHPPFPPDLGALVSQLHSTRLAAEVKLTLMNQYPDDHPVTLIHRASLPNEALEPFALHEIDRSRSIGELTCLFVPAVAEASSFETLQNTVARLRAPDGCPWDREQTHLSLRRHLLEEAYEVLSALDSEDSSALREELGDLLLQIVLQAQIATEAATFSTAEVIRGIQAKLIRRHPHVFGGAAVNGVEQVLRNWEHFKEQETGSSPLAGVPAALPALAQAAELQGRASRLGFDWPSPDGVVEKIHEELAEIEQAEPEAVASEVGDLLFAAVNYARWLEVDPESALRQANLRFRARFDRMNELARGRGAVLEGLTLEEMDRLWEEAKGEE
jgi:tetrapyrrole methylase family protein/MazG family protein